MNTMSNPITILIVDDETMIFESIADILEDEGYRVFTAENAAQAREQYRTHNPDLVLLDIWMPDTDGISLLREWQDSGNPHTMTIMMSGHGNIETAVEATKLGAYDFLEKPLSTGKMLLTINRALQTQALKSQNAALKSKIAPDIELIGNSRVMRDLRERATQLANQSATLTLTGSAGTGKQQLAHYIHQHSPRHEQPFIAANIAAMDSDNILANLSGDSKRAGMIAQADGGTLYIDEASLLPTDAQKLLSQIIEHSAYQHGDGKGERQVDVRLIFASRLPLNLLKERLGNELFDHLSVATLAIADLHSHNEDIPDLLDYFVNYFADVEEMPYRHFSLAAQNLLRQHTWQGNVREVRNLVQRLLLASDDPDIELEEARDALSPLESPAPNDRWSQIIPKDLSLREAREMFEHQYLLEQFRHCDGNVAQLAGRVGMDRTNLYRKLRSLGIDPTHKPI